MQVYMPNRNEVECKIAPPQKTHRKTVGVPSVREREQKHMGGKKISIYHNAVLENVVSLLAYLHVGSRQRVDSMKLSSNDNFDNLAHQSDHADCKHTPAG